MADHSDDGPLDLERGQKRPKSHRDYGDCRKASRLFKTYYGEIERNFPNRTRVEFPLQDRLVTWRPNHTVRSALSLWPGIDLDPQDSFGKIRRTALAEARKLRESVIFHGPNGPGAGFDIRKLALLDGSTLREIAEPAALLYELFPNAHHYLVTHSWSTMVALYFLGRLATPEMRECTTVISIAGLMWLPAGTETGGLLDDFAGMDYTGIEVASIYTPDDDRLPAALAQLPGVPGFRVRVGWRKGGPKPHLEILRSKETMTHSRSVIYQDLTARSSLAKMHQRRRPFGLGTV